VLNGFALWKQQMITEFDNRVLKHILYLEIISDRMGTNIE